MASEFRMTHRVEFADTDMAGIIHFSSYFRYMEVTEHAFFRSLGASVAGKDEYGWPRVHVSCDFRLPLRFEDEVEVQLLVREKKSKSLSYEFIFRKVGENPMQEVARGKLTAVCVLLDTATGRMKAASIPERIASQISVAPTDTQE